VTLFLSLSLSLSVPSLSFLSSSSSSSSFDYKCNSSGCCFCCCSAGFFAAAAAAPGFAAILRAADLGTKEGFALVASTGLDGSGGGVSSFLGAGDFDDGLPDMTLTGWTDSTGAQPVFFGFCCCCC